jgi:hypothetical protein
MEAASEAISADERFFVGEALVLVDTTSLPASCGVRLHQ